MAGSADLYELTLTNRLINETTFLIQTLWTQFLQQFFLHLNFSDRTRAGNLLSTNKHTLSSLIVTVNKICNLNDLNLLFKIYFLMNVQKFQIIPKPGSFLLWICSSSYDRWSNGSLKLDEGGVGSSNKLADSFVWLKTLPIFKITVVLNRVWKSQ